MKEDRICIFNEEKMNKNKNINKNETETESENVEKKIFAENDNLLQNSNRAETFSNDKQTFSTTGTTKKISANSIDNRKNNTKFVTNITKKTVERKKDDIYMKTEININNNIINDENQKIEPFYTVINTTEDNVATKNKIKKNTQKTLSLNLNSKNNFSNLVKTKKLADNYLSLGNKNDIQNLLLKKPKDKIQVDKLFNVKKEEKAVNNLNSPISLKKDNKTATEIQQQILNKFSNYVCYIYKIIGYFSF